MVRSPNSYSNTNRSFSSITLLAFHGMPCFLHAPATKEQCQECSRSTLSGMSPVRTSLYTPLPPYLFWICSFYRTYGQFLLDLFIPKGLEWICGTLKARTARIHRRQKAHAIAQRWLSHIPRGSQEVCSGC